MSSLSPVKGFLSAVTLARRPNRRAALKVGAGLAAVPVLSGLAACGASPLQKIRFALWPQVKPLFLSYGFMRLEINFRSSTILGLVGAGGIGQELMTNIKLDRYDQVSITLLLIILVVSALDMLSGRLRLWVLEGKK